MTALSSAAASATKSGTQAATSLAILRDARLFLLQTQTLPNSTNGFTQRSTRQCAMNAQLWKATATTTPRTRSMSISGTTSATGTLRLQNSASAETTSTKKTELFLYC